ncbi:MAG: ThuA domain-containing protein [Verrucomicrobia bacterium]|nr:ThuA domain-containing protein [Verrucomicrobiota bacterium]
MTRSFVFAVSVFLVSAAAVRAADAPKPLRVLLITGGCCHDYAKQKDILKKGLEERANVVVDQIHTDDKSTHPPLPIYGNADYAKGYDVVIHDECSSDIKDPATIEAVLAPHRHGIPGVNLHCAMHCYRFGNYGQPVKIGDANSFWYEYLGLQSTGHGPQEPIALNFVNKDHAVTKGLENWTTVKEELYNNIQVLPGATPLVRGKQIVHQKSKDKEGKETITDKEVETVVGWVNDYKGTRVFSTTVGHNNATVDDARYLDFVTRGVLWACGKLDDSGKPKPGYGPAAK